MEETTAHYWLIPASNFSPKTWKCPWTFQQWAKDPAVQTLTCWTLQENNLSKFLSSHVTKPSPGIPWGISEDEFPSGSAEWHECTLPFLEWGEMEPTFTKNLLRAEMDVPESLCFTWLRKYFRTRYIPQDPSCKSCGITMVIFSTYSNYAYTSSLNTWGSFNLPEIKVIT